jgi:hypothetical protein
MGEQKELEKKLELKLGKEDLAARKRKLEKETGGLLTDEALMAIIGDEEGLTEMTVSCLADLKPGDPVFASCRLDSIEAPREFRTRDKVGKLRKLRVSDDTGSLVITLWDEETALPEQLGLKAGSSVRILSAELKQTRYGPEIHIGRTGFLVPEGNGNGRKVRKSRAKMEPPESAGGRASSPEPEMGPGPAGSPSISGTKPAPTASEAENEELALSTVKELPCPGRRVIVTGVIVALKASGRGRARQVVARFFDGTGECDAVFQGASIPQIANLEVGSELELAKALVMMRDGQNCIVCDDMTEVKAK